MRMNFMRARMCSKRALQPREVRCGILTIRLHCVYSTNEMTQQKYIASELTINYVRNRHLHNRMITASTYSMDSPLVFPLANVSLEERRYSLALGAPPFRHSQCAYHC